MLKQKRGWIRIVEAFVAVLLIAGVLLIVLNKTSVGGNVSEEIYEIEKGILREIELSSSLRQEVLLVSGSFVAWGNFDSNGLEGVRNKINERTPADLICEARVCDLDKVCAMEQIIDADVYAQAVAITANNEIYSPRQLKLFCWKK